MTARTFRNVALAVAAVAILQAPILAHHSFAMYDQNKTVTITGAVKQYVPQDRPPAFTRFNLFLRDGFSCQYCGAPDDLTFDHVIPRSRGGRTTWMNVVTACSDCLFPPSFSISASAMTKATIASKMGTARGTGQKSERSYLVGAFCPMARSTVC